jgi:hypothetical protein
MRSDLGLSVLGAAIGAGAMFLLDPRLGKRRRALLRDRTVSFSRHTATAIDKTARDLKNRTHGTVVSIKSGHPMRGGFALLNANWPPAIRLLVGTTGGIITALGLARGNRAGRILSGIGIGSLVFAITNLSVRDTIKSTRGKIALFHRNAA